MKTFASSAGVLRTSDPQTRASDSAVSWVSWSLGRGKVAGKGGRWGDAAAEGKGRGRRTPSGEFGLF